MQLMFGLKTLRTKLKRYSKENGKTETQLKVSYWVLSVTFLSFLLITGSVSSSGSLPFIVQQCHV